MITFAFVNWLIDKTGGFALTKSLEKLLGLKKKPVLVAPESPEKIFERTRAFSHWCLTNSGWDALHHSGKHNSVIELTTYASTVGMPTDLVVSLKEFEVPEELGFIILTIKNSKGNSGLHGGTFIFWTYEGALYRGELLTSGKLKIEESNGGQLKSEEDSILRNCNYIANSKLKEMELGKWWSWITLKRSFC